MWRGRILLLDDEPAILFGVQEFLGAHGYCVECARTAAEARERLDRARPGHRLQPADQRGRDQDTFGLLFIRC